jgi:cytochrome c
VSAARRLAIASMLLAAAPPAHAAGDAGRGARVFQKCYACHSLVPGERNLQGPSLVHLWGRCAGSVPDFEYSKALGAVGRACALRWDAATLDAFIADPQRTLPGIAMGFFGIKDADERADLIAYLKDAAR